MIRKASSYSSLSSWAIASTAAVGLLMQSTPARAEEVSGTGKGITGGALLGGEAVMLVEAVAGVKPAWAYIVGGLVGAGGGAAGGYFVEQNGSAKAASYLLAGGLVLLIPTTVAVLQATSYQPPEDYTEDKPAAGSPVPEPPRQQTPPAKPGASLPASLEAPLATRTLHYHWQPTRLTLPAGLLAMADSGAVSLAVPAVQIAPVYQVEEMQKYGLEQKHELRLPVFSATF